MDLTILGIESSCDDTGSPNMWHNAPIERYRLAGGARQVWR